METNKVVLFACMHMFVSLQKEKIYLAYFVCVCASCIVWWMSIWIFVQLFDGDLSCAKCCIRVYKTRRGQERKKGHTFQWKVTHILNCINIKTIASERKKSAFVIVVTFGSPYIFSVPLLATLISLSLALSSFFFSSSFSAFLQTILLKIIRSTVEHIQRQWTKRKMRVTNQIHR